MSETRVNQFFGDAEHAFDLTPDMIAELERITGAGIGGLCKRLFAGEFHRAEIVESIRLGLIGAGMNPQAALAMVNAYAASRPLGETYPLAVTILEALWFGAPTKEAVDEPA